MSRHFATFVRFFLLVFGVTAVLTLTVQAAPPAQDITSTRPRFDLAQIPHQPSQEPPTESALAVTAPDALLPWSKVAFQSLRNGNWDIFVGNDDGTGQTAVVTTTHADIHPHLNRGNTRIVYANNNGGDYEIYTVNYAGTGKTSLTNNSSHDVNPSWSPDGSKIVFESYRNGEADIYVMNANGTNQTRLTTSSDFDGMPTWSPDGTQIAFVSRRTGGYRIYVMNADGSGQTQLSNQPYSLRPHWSPDGTQIAYDADNDGDGWQDLWRMDADGSNQGQLYNPSGQKDIWVSGWSPDSNYIVYTLVSFIYYQGNWYWTDAYPEAWQQNVGINRLSTNGLDWDASWQTSDITPPISQMNTLAAESPSPIPASWTGSDTGGSGIARYSVQVKVGSGNWEDWKTETTSAYGGYTASGGDTVAFRVRARDRAFNYETWPLSADTATTVESLPPVTTINIAPTYSRYNQNLVVTWGGSDPGYSGIKNYDVQYKMGLNGAWVNWQTDTGQTTAVLEGGTAGETYYFRVRGTDKANNTESWTGGIGDDQVTFYRWASYGQAFDNTHTPISGATSTTTPTADSIVPSTTEGNYISYVLENSSLYTAAWSKPGYGPLPTTSFIPDPDGYHNAVLPPEDNLIANWDFETGSASPEWSVTGTSSSVVTDTAQNSGNYGVSFGTPNVTESHNLTQLWGDYVTPIMAVDPTGSVHAIWREFESTRTLYSELNSNGSWALPIAISSSDTPFAGIDNFMVDKNGIIHVIMKVDNTEGSLQKVDLYYTRRNLNKNWSTPAKIYTTANPYGNSVYETDIFVDDSGFLHLVWRERIYVGYSTTCGFDVFYSRRSPNGSWESPINISEDCTGSTPAIHHQGGNIHVLWGRNHRMRNANGIWADKETMYSGNYNVTDAHIDNQGVIHLLIKQIHSDPIYYVNNENSWSEPMYIGDGGFSFIVSDSVGNLHTVWQSTNFTEEIYYRKRTADKVWQTPRIIFEDIITLQNMIIDPNDKIHIALQRVTGETQNLFYSWKDHNDSWAQEINITNTTLSAYFFQFEVDSFGNYHLRWRETSGISGENYTTFYAGPTFASQAEFRSIAQEASLLPGLENPVLSFMYQLGGVSVNGESEFLVKLNSSGGEETIFSTKNSTPGWKHHWLDLSAWSNEVVTLSFELAQSANSPIAWIYLDEISLGSTYNDVWVEIESVNAWIGETVPIVISYGNRGGALAEDAEISLSLPAFLVFEGSDVASINASTPTWQVGNLPAKGEPQEIIVYVRVRKVAPSFTELTNSVSITTSSTELESINNVDSGTLFTGRDIFLPTVHK